MSVTYLFLHILFC